jgi:hypothetical protein
MVKQNIGMSYILKGHIYLAASLAAISRASFLAALSAAAAAPPPAVTEAGSAVAVPNFASAALFFFDALDLLRLADDDDIEDLFMVAAVCVSVRGTSGTPDATALSAGTPALISAVIDSGVVLTGAAIALALIVSFVVVLPGLPSAAIAAVASLSEAVASLAVDLALILSFAVAILSAPDEGAVDLFTINVDCLFLRAFAEDVAVPSTVSTLLYVTTCSVVPTIVALSFAASVALAAASVLSPTPPLCIAVALSDVVPLPAAAALSTVVALSAASAASLYSAATSAGVNTTIVN